MSDQDIQKYEQMLVEDPQSRAFAPLAEAYRKVGKLDDAIRVAETGLEIHPGYTGGLVVLGRAHFEKKELDKATEILEKAVSENPESYLGQKFLGKALMDKGEIQKALRALEAANMLSPDDGEVVSLLEEIRPKAGPPKTIEYSGEEGDHGADDPEIVTYEQKPTTVDGVELDPLPVEVDEETFSFSDLQVDGEEITVVTPPGEDNTSEEESASMADLGPEAAAFIEEAEKLDEDLFTVQEKESGQPEFQAAPEVVIEGIPLEPEELASEPVSADRLPAPAEEPFSAGIPVPSSPEPVPMTEAPAGSASESEAGAAAISPQPPVLPSDAGIDEPVPPVITGLSPDVSGGEGASPETPEPSMDHSATGGAISTETLADLYAKQGLSDKAAEIYRQILDERPEDQSVLLKLRALEGNPLAEEPQGGAAAIPGGPGTESTSLEIDDPTDILQAWLDNAERMKRP